VLLGTPSRQLLHPSDPSYGILLVFCLACCGKCNRLISANGHNQRGCWVVRLWQCRRQGAVRRHVRGPHARLSKVVLCHLRLRRAQAKQLSFARSLLTATTTFPSAAAPVVTDCHVSIRALLPQAGDLIATGSCQTKCGHTHSGRTPFRSCE